MKKRICALLLCLLSLTAFPLTALATDNSPALTLETSREGNTLTVTVGIENNPGIAGADLTLQFNRTALTPSAAPAMTGTWHSTITNYEASFSGDVLRICSVNQSNITGDITLFTVQFTVNGSGTDYGLCVSGSVCSEDAEALIELPKVYGDGFGVSATVLSSGALTATVTSHGSGYDGDAKAILACYQDGKFVGCKLQDVTIEDGETVISFTAFSFSGTSYKLMLTDSNFKPLCAAIAVTAQ